MVSFCIKTNNQSDITKLPEYISRIELENVVFVTKNFSKYTNIIVHYLGPDIDYFYDCFAEALCNYIIDYYEPNILSKILFSNFFYFSHAELLEIKKLCNSLINNKLDRSLSIKDLKHDLEEFPDRRKLLFNSILNYIKNEKSMVLSGFIKFRIYDYINILNNFIDLAVSEFVVNKEYSEFIELLRLYINSRNSNINLVHLIYINEESILLDENKNVISLSHNNLDIPYLSDITFSSNDYALNSLLSLVPQKLIIHLIDKEDDFINTLKLIFDDRVETCKDCNICKTYKLVKKDEISNNRSLHV